jgi:hypothetical protein
MLYYKSMYPHPSLPNGSLCFSCAFAVFLCMLTVTTWCLSVLIGPFPEPRRHAPQVFSASPGAPGDRQTWEQPALCCRDHCWWVVLLWIVWDVDQLEQQLNLFCLQDWSGGPSIGHSTRYLLYGNHWYQSSALHCSTLPWRLLLTGACALPLQRWVSSSHLVQEHVALISVRMKGKSHFTLMYDIDWVTFETCILQVPA